MIVGQQDEPEMVPMIETCVESLFFYQVEGFWLRLMVRDSISQWNHQDDSGMDLCSVWDVKWSPIGSDS